MVLECNHGNTGLWEETREGRRETWGCHGADTNERAKGTGRDFSPVFPDSTLLLFKGKKALPHIRSRCLIFNFVYLRLGIFKNHNASGNYYFHEHWFRRQSHFFCRIMVVYVSQGEVKTRPCRCVGIMWWGKLLRRWTGIPHQCVLGWFQHLFMWKVSTSVHTGFLNI